jgi:hypothetical protein
MSALLDSEVSTRRDYWRNTAVTPTKIQSSWRRIFVDRSYHIGPFLVGWSATLSATWKAAENDCLERRNSIRPCVPSHVAYKAERGGNELFWSPWKMYPRSQERHRNREATVYLPALGGDGPRLDRTIRIYKCSQASSAEESLKCCAALLAVSTEASGFSVMGNQHCRRIEQT